MFFLEYAEITLSLQILEKNVTKVGYKYLGTAFDSKCTNPVCTILGLCPL
jgi:hypothetical protein